MHKSLPQNHLCSVTLLGNLVAKPEIRYQANPVIPIAEFVIATHHEWFDKVTQQKKQWTHYHTVKMIGDVVERSLLLAEKGDVVLIQGHLVNSKKSNREIVHATYARSYPKGYTQSINQLQCSGQIASDIKLVTTQANKLLAEFLLAIDYFVYSPITHELRSIQIQRPVHVWGSLASFIHEHGHLGQEIIVDGKLSYLNNESKSQLIESKLVIVQKS